MVQLGFHGAAQSVSGSKYLLEADRARVLIDCGLFQGLKELRLRNWEAPGFEPSSVQAVVLTHAHIDHSGYLPRLVKAGFRGKVYCSEATKELAKLLLLDSAKNQKRDASYLNRKGFTRHKPALPLYDSADARRAIKRLRGVPLDEWFSPRKPLWMRLHDAGHLLGSAMVEVEIRDRPGGARPLRLLFSGDVGRYNAPLYFDPQPPPPCDYLVCESTYGDREHPETDVLASLRDVVLRANRRGGVILVASFSVGRTQQLTYLARVLIQRGAIPPMPIYIDSPMAVNATDIYCGYSGEHDLSEGQPPGDGCVLSSGNVHLVTTVAESKKLNRLKGPAMIISSSGMMTGGRILFHLKRRLPDSRNTVLAAGYMVPGTRGRRLVDGEKTLRIHRQDIPVRAAVERISGLSGHAGRGELLRWLSSLPKPRQVFLTHGEPRSMTALADTLRRERGWDVATPQLGETRSLDLSGGE
jgi:metallo-beta-lactamase family protein